MIKLSGKKSHSRHVFVVIVVLFLFCFVVVLGISLSEEIKVQWDKMLKTVKKEIEDEPTM